MDEREATPDDGPLPPPQADPLAQNPAGHPARQNPARLAG